MMGGVQPTVKLLKQFDKDGDGLLNAAERKAAREFLAQEKTSGRGQQRGPRGGGQSSGPVVPGPKVAAADAKSFAAAPLFDPQAYRTLFFEFEDSDWEKEMAEFYHSDADVPAKLTVDGKTYKDVGVHFRGASSFFTVAEGRKRSLSVSMNEGNGDQRLGGYRTLNLLNSHEDPSYLRSILYLQIAREYIPAPKANLVRVVINGESWGPYVSVQHFDKDFIKDWFKTTKGARWKVPGSPGARGGLAYIGDDVAAYKKIYEIKSKDDPKAWADLVKLCRVLNQTPADKLEAALAPILDIDETLKFLALDNVFVNNDGYWIRTSDYSIYEDEKGRFHIIPHDANETFAIPERPRGGGGGGDAVKGVELDPLVAANDPAKALLNKMLAVPALKTRYLKYVRTMAEQSLDWKKLGPIAQQYQALIAADLKADTRKLDSYEDFTKSLTVDTEGQGFRGPQRNISLKSFVEQRRAYLLEYPEIKSLAR